MRARIASSVAVFTGSAMANMRLIRGSISRNDGLSSGRSPHRGEVHLGAPPKSARRMPIGLGEEGDPQFLVPAVERRVSPSPIVSIPKTRGLD